MMPESALLRDILDAALSEQERARVEGRDLAALQSALGYSFRDEGLLEEALCHASFANEHGLAVSNERLEFLGDSVLGFVVARALYRLYPEAREGDLTQKRAELVCGRSLLDRARELNLPSLILHGHSVRDEALPASMCEDAVEALLGAVCLDGGVQAAEGVIGRLFLQEAEVRAETDVSPKSRLQTWLQARRIPLPTYEVVSVTGPSHAPSFRVRLRVNGVEHIACGSTRKGAESDAAERVLEDLMSLDVDE